jgi:hypothetical protein
MLADEVMAIILHLAHNMDDELPGTYMPSPFGTASPISMFVATYCGLHGRRGHSGRDGRSGRGLPNKCTACGSLDHIMLSCTASNDALLKWNLAKLKLMIHKCGTPGGAASPHAAIVSDVPPDDSHVPSSTVMPTQD